MLRNFSHEKENDEVVGTQLNANKSEINRDGSNVGKLKQALRTNTVQDKLIPKRDKKRRALGDISNKHRNQLSEKFNKGSLKTTSSPLHKPKSLFKDTKIEEKIHKKRKSVEKIEAKTPKAKVDSENVESKDDVEEIEKPYGGLPTSEDDDLLRTHNDIIRELEENPEGILFDKQFAPLLKSDRAQGPKFCIDEEIEKNPVSSSPLSDHYIIDFIDIPDILDDKPALATDDIADLDDLLNFESIVHQEKNDK